MEQHFILRVSEELRLKLENEIAEKGFPNAEVEVTKDGKYFFKYDKSYQMNLTKLPCIIESYKSFDNKQFCKTSDISTLFVVDGFSSEVDGLTPPMKFVKERRFRKRKEIDYHEESIENRVRALLEKDALANETSVTWMNKEKEETELKEMIKEIEAGFEEPQSTQQQFEDKLEEKIEEKEEKLKFELKNESEEKEIDKRIKELEEAIKKAPNAILKKRFEQRLKDIIEEKKMNEK